MKTKALLLALLISVSSLASAAPAPTTLNFCTGGEGGFYQDLGSAIGNSITKNTDIQLNVLTTGGSVENAELMKDGDCDIAIMQADAAVTKPLPTDVKIVDGHMEQVYWLHGKTGIDDFGKMEDDAVAKKYAFAAVSGSGALVTVRN
jgi:ABC-type glycerol-3-phosphate transport system substrate-binding protein